MTARKVWWSGAWVTLSDGGSGDGSLTDQFPSTLLDDGVATASSVRNTITATASGTPHTAGSYVEVDPALSADAAGIFLYLAASTSASGANSSTLLEIATGGSGSEVVWATIGVGYTAERFIWVPGFIASGARVAVRARSAVASQAVTAVYSFLKCKSIAPAAPVTIGADTATSRGVTVTAPGSLNTKGAWTQLTASTPSAFGQLGIYPQGAAGAAMNTSGVLVDIGIGAAASETVLLSDIYLGGNANERYIASTPLLYGVTVGAGSRLSARYARANAGNALDLILVGA